MASGTISIGSAGVMQGRIYWSSTANTSSNSSTVSAYLQIKCGAGNYTRRLVYNLTAFTTSGNELAWKDSGTTHIETNITNSWKTLLSTSFTVSHWDDGSYALYLGGTISANNGELITNKVNPNYLGTRVWLDTIPRSATITTAPNFNDEQNPTITYSNPAGNNVTSLQACISLNTTKDDILYRDIPTTGTSYTFNLTEAERDVLRKATLNGSDKRKVWFYVRTIVGETTYHSSLEKELTIINATPEVNAYWWDSDADCYALTNDNEVFIKGYSNLSYMLSATPKKHATITKYTSTVDYTHTSTTPMDGNQDAHWNITKDKITLTATDNRGLVGKMESPIYMIDYFPPTCGFSASNIELDEESGTTASAHVEVSGEFFNEKFGPNGVQNQLKIEILHTGLDDWFELPDILWGDGVDGNTYKASFDVNGLDYQKTITFQFRVSDKLISNITTEEKTLKLFPIFDWSDEDFNFNVPVTIQGNKLNDFVVSTGTASMGSNGTWYWSKWASGKAECYGVRNYGNMAVTTAWGSLYQSDYFSQSLPSGLFVAAPQAISIDFYSTTNTAYGWITKGGSVPTATNTGQFFVTRGTGTTLSAAHISFNVIGRWK